MKVSSSSKKEPSTKIKKLGEKLLSLKLENSELRKQLRAERKRRKGAVQSRDKWKARNRERANKLKGLERKQARKDKPARHHFEVNVISLCILLRIVGGCSYRSIPRILEVIRKCFEVPWEKIPCANTVENWVSKMGLYSIMKSVEKLKKVSDQVCLIIDENLRLGNERMLLFLLVPYEKQKDSALNYEDVEVVYMCGKKSWTGEGIENEVTKIINEQGMQIGNILSDEDSKLLKSARLLDIAHLPDIGHAIGNCLRKVFMKNEYYKAFIKLVGQLQSKSVNQKLTFLRPPKQRTKARFMNQCPLVKWGITMLTRFNELDKEEQDFFEDLKEHQLILNTLSHCMELSKVISVSLKEKGLSQSTLTTIKEEIAKSKRSLRPKKKENLIKEMVLQFIEHLEKYAQRYKEFLGEKQGSYHVSSDVIESIFGKHKNMVSKNPLVGMTILDLELPVYCKEENEIINLVQRALEEIFMTNLSEWRATHSSDNQALKRKVFFEKRA